MNQPTFFSTARILSCLALLIIIVAWSCDSYDPDVVPKDKVSVGQTQFYALSNSSTMIDLKTVVKSYSPVDLFISKQPGQGSLTKLGGGRYAYMPQTDLRSGRDYFTLDVRRDGQTVQFDTIYIEIGQDTTQLPCGIYAVTDFVSVPSAAAGQVIPIAVLANDHICGVDSSDLVVSLFSSPQHGTAVPNGTNILYTTSGFTGSDSFLYSIKSLADTSVHAIGLVKLLLGTDSCNLILRGDDVLVDLDTLHSNTVLVNVLQDDDICDPNTDLSSIVTQPRHGTAAFVDFNTIAYTPSAPVTGLHDSLSYQVCHGSICKTAVVSYTFVGGSCVVTAQPDSVTILKGSGFGLDIFVLDNDEACGAVKSLTIVTVPKTGTAVVQGDNSIFYLPNSSSSPSDSLKYQLCGVSGGCSQAWVKIDRH